MSDDLPPYQGQNWLCLTDAELRELTTMPDAPVWFMVKVGRLLMALEQRLVENAALARKA
jgi:hypothetical protein